MYNFILANRVALDLNSWFAKIKDEFYINFIAEDRYMYLVKGLWMTLRITFFAVLLGIALGVIAAIVRSTHDKTIKEMRPGLAKGLLIFFNAIVKLYLTVVQLMIMYYIIFASSTNAMLVAVLAFGINSGAYVAEIIRSGIMSIDNGQFEAGRSLGFNYIQTMYYIVIPQALKNVLPALANEFIVLIKETSVSGYVGIMDLTRGGDVIRSRTFVAFMPLFAVAAIYLIIVVIFSKLVTVMERRLRNSER